MKREFDVITGEKSQLEELYVLKGFPVNMLAEYGDGSHDNDARYDMSFCISPSTGIIQLKETVPEELVYIDAHSNAVGGVWKRHHELLAKTIAEFLPERVLEIGGGTGILERTYNNSSEKKQLSGQLLIHNQIPLILKRVLLRVFFRRRMKREYNLTL